MIAAITEPTMAEIMFARCAFRPDTLLLATPGPTSETPDGLRGKIINEWRLAPNILVGDHDQSSGIPTSVSYSIAKVLLVGDTGVGKSGLAKRLLYDRWEKTDSTHARKTYLLERILQPPVNPVRVRETVLWDLAGQVGYRLVHRLSMEDVAVACVLFNAHSETDPFSAAIYWAKALKEAGTHDRIIKFLVVSRMDVAGLAVSHERIEEFRKLHGFSAVFYTSAKSGKGCDELRAAILNAIDWSKFPQTTTTQSLIALRSTIETVKGSRVAKLHTVAELKSAFEKEVYRQASLAELEPLIRNLEARGVVDVLQDPNDPLSLDDYVLLDPTRMDAYASAILMTARNQRDGPGHLLEARIERGEFEMNDEDRIEDKKLESRVLWYVVDALLSHDLALYERIAGQAYIVFPSQCTAESPMPEDLPLEVAFRFSGPVESVYATLIAQLAHYSGFSGRTFYRQGAQYHLSKGGSCWVQLVDDERGRGEIQVKFSDNPSPELREGFIRFVHSFMRRSRRISGDIEMLHPSKCKHCNYVFPEDLVGRRRSRGETSMICGDCGGVTEMENLLVGNSFEGKEVHEQMEADVPIGREAMRRSRIQFEAKYAELLPIPNSEQMDSESDSGSLANDTSMLNVGTVKTTSGRDDVISKVLSFKRALRKYDLFLSHNSKDKPLVEKLARKLLSIGILPWFDSWDLMDGETISDALENAIDSIPCAALFFGPHDTGRWHIIEMRAYFEDWAKSDAHLIPVILPGVNERPPKQRFLGQVLWADLSRWEESGSPGFRRFVLGILRRPPGFETLGDITFEEVMQIQGIDINAIEQESNLLHLEASSLERKLVSELISEIQRLGGVEACFEKHAEEILTYLFEREAQFLSLAQTPILGDKRPYTRKIISNHPFEILIAKWRPGVRCAPHDHAGGKGWVIPLKGNFFERQFRLRKRHSNGSEAWALEPDDTRTASYLFGDGARILKVLPETLHDMKCSEDGVTLHFYKSADDSKWGGDLGMMTADVSKGIIYLHSTKCPPNKGGAWLPPDKECVVRAWELEDFIKERPEYVRMWG